MKNLSQFTGKNLAWIPFSSTLQHAGLQVYYKENLSSVFFFVNFNKAFSTKNWIIENYVHPLIPTNAAKILTS